jgi:hypothetical protein
VSKRASLRFHEVTHSALKGEVDMNKTPLAIFRTAISATLIVGSVFVQHVAREQQPQHRHAGLQLNDSIGDELADYIIESGKAFFTLIR